LAAIFQAHGVSSSRLVLFVFVSAALFAICWHIQPTLSSCRVRVLRFRDQWLESRELFDDAADVLTARRSFGALVKRGMDNLSRGLSSVRSFGLHGKEEPVDLGYDRFELRERPVTRPPQGIWI
jgi:hypothetical protein